jgi:circadian clock protein KaiB
MGHSTDQPELQSFKGIALFTPGGDLVYGLDPDKQQHWHLQLCASLQELLDLPAPPHFLVPCYTATVDCWPLPQTHQIKTVAEAHRPVIRYQSLLNAIFGTPNLVWRVAPGSEQCEPMVLSTYYEQFPQLWDNHDIVVRVDRVVGSRPLRRLIQSPSLEQVESGYVLRLFVSGYGPTTEEILKRLYALLENRLRSPYTLKVIDVLKHPEEAEANQVAATPTLVKVWPPPIRRIVGVLDHGEMVLRALGVGEMG